MIYELFLLRKLFTFDIANIIYQFGKTYPHELEDKYHKHFNLVLDKMPKLSIPNWISDNYSNNFVIYYKPKKSYSWEWDEWFEPTKKYDPNINSSKYVHFLYVLRRFKETVFIEEVTNCEINDEEEYLKWTSNNKTKKSLLFNFGNDN